MLGVGAYAFPCDPDQSPLDAPALWSPDICPATLILEANPAAGTRPHGAKISAIEGVIAECHQCDGRHLVIADDQGHHRLWLRRASTAHGHAFTIVADKHFDARIAVAKRLMRKLDGRRSGPLPSSFTPTLFQHGRLTLLLRLLDSERSGANRRDMAFTILFRNHAPLTNAQWKGSSARRRTQRMLAQAHHLMAIGYRSLVGGRLPVVLMGRH